MTIGSEDYGTKINSALSAIRRMHSDVSKLLVDADGSIGTGLDSVFGSYATINLTYSYKADCWMSSFVYRLYSNQNQPGVVKGISVWFFDKSNMITEPLILAGELAYELAPDQKIASICDGYDQISAYSKWHDAPSQSTVLVGTRPIQKPSVKWYKIIATPLYSIGSMGDVVDLMKRVEAEGLST